MTMTLERSFFEELDRRVRGLAHAESPSEVFKSLLEGSRLAAPRAAIYLVRQSRIKGWGTAGYPAEAAKLHRGQTAPLGEGWLGRVAAHDGSLHEPDAAQHCPDFGQPTPSECVGSVVRVKNRPIALVVIERSGPEEPWRPYLLGTLVTVAQLRLDLDLARRKLAPTAPETAPAKAPTAPLETAATPRTSESVAVPEESERPAADDPRYEAARRYARLVATDIRLYNEDAVAQGRSAGDLTDRLAEDLARGKETFLRRHGELGPLALQILREAYVQVLAGGDEELVPASALD